MHDRLNCLQLRIEAAAKRYGVALPAKPEPIEVDWEACMASALELKRIAQRGRANIIRAMCERRGFGAMRIGF
ncbi:hypothetical protein [Brucella pseudintermedia]|uniref:hypothetical protein n=1 Tax=Brucella pseudintermedia TaxID=370111 RepID=UPI00124D8862|nr:hypothetical protein [Brucella pseudintermedia]KAB2680340.1 hypothetical protein F9K78_16765 [Brucella pseudintermedia]